MDADKLPRRRWYQFSLRTMFVVTVVVSIPLAWVGYQYNWHVQRREFYRNHVITTSIECSNRGNVPDAPFPLWLFGEEKGLEYVMFRYDAPYTEADVQRIFPEAHIVVLEKGSFFEIRTRPVPPEN